MNRRFASFSRLAFARPCLAVLILLIGGTRLSAQTPPPDYWQGTHAFRYMLEKRCGFDFVDKLTARDDPSTCLVVILGDADALQAVPVSLGEFLRRGGALLLATDHKVSDPRLRAYGIEISGRILRKKGEGTYRSLSACPFLQPSADDAPGLFEGLTTASGDDASAKVATNVASYLSVSADPNAVCAYLPAGSYFTDEQNPARQQFFVEPVPFGIALKKRGIKDEGRLLVLADHSIFINDMMQQTDNGNAAFAYRAISWLNDWGNRDRVLFIENGTVQKKADIKLQALPHPPAPPLPSLDTVIGMGDELLGGLEQQDVINRALISLVPPPVMLRWLLYLLTGGLLAYGLSRLLKGRHRMELSAPLLATAVARVTPSINPIEQRNRALLESGNLWEPARLLALQFFESTIGAEALRPQHQTAVRFRLPPFQVNLRGLRGWLLGQRVRRLWRFAHLARPQAVSIGQFRKLTRQIADLKKAARQGTLRFSSLTPWSVPR